MKTDVLDQNGKVVEKLELSKEVFGLKPNPNLLAQYLKVFMSNQRQGTASAKTRAEVSGSGRKPWRQKGTGRARAGSIRSPLWRHGGVVHPPKPKDWRLSLPKKMRQAAIKSALSLKHSKDQILILDKFDIKSPKTKEIINLLNNLKLPSKTLIVLNEKNNSLVKSAKNIDKVRISLADNLNAYELLNADKVLFLKDAVLKLQEKYKVKDKS